MPRLVLRPERQNEINNSIKAAKVADKMKKKPSFPHTCQRCGKTFELAVQLDPSKPIYCQECRDLVKKEREERGSRPMQSQPPRGDRPPREADRGPARSAEPRSRHEGSVGTTPSRRADEAKSVGSSAPRESFVIKPRIPKESIPSPSFDGPSIPESREGVLPALSTKSITEDDTPLSVFMDGSSDSDDTSSQGGSVAPGQVVKF